MDRKIMRTGKTEKDRANNAAKTNAENKSRRAAWYKEEGHSNTNFPKETCNGKANRF